mgnify:CR=1 FL=1
MESRKSKSEPSQVRHIENNSRISTYSRKAKNLGWTGTLLERIKPSKSSSYGPQIRFNVLIYHIKSNRFVGFVFRLLTDDWWVVSRFSRKQARLKFHRILRLHQRHSIWYFRDWISGRWISVFPGLGRLRAQLQLNLIILRALWIISRLGALE